MTKASCLDDKIQSISIVRYILIPYLTTTHYHNIHIEETNKQKALSVLLLFSYTHCLSCSMRSIVHFSGFKEYTNFRNFFNIILFLNFYNYYNKILHLSNR